MKNVLNKVKKLLKGAVIAALAGALILPTMGTSDVYAADELSVYNDFIEDKAYFEIYTLIDIDGNGKQEILITPDESLNMQSMYTLVNGKFVEVFDLLQGFGDDYRFNSDTHEILAYRSGNDSKDVLIWKTDGTFRRYYWNGTNYMCCTSQETEDLDDTSLFYCEKSEYDEVYSHYQNGYRYTWEYVCYPIVKVVNCQSYITLRSQPNANASKITTIPLGKYVTYIKSVSNGYAYVNYSGRRGYVMEEYLSSTPTVTPEEDYIEESGNESTTWTAHVVNCKTSITLRTEPNVYAAEIVQIPLGAEVTIYDPNAGNGFCYVEYNGDMGYCLASYLK